ncbi:MAG: thymidine phosphorylase, partial [Candidatus Kryptoniota bacterium]
SDEQLRYFIKGYSNGEIHDYQASALLMAIFFRGMNDREVTSLTRAMIETGQVVDLSEITGCKVDKHSTGGVGDKISLLLAPLAAACGAKVPMVSGRGLGHTGGTIDKLESIPGFRTALSISEYKDILKRVGLVMSAQSEDIVPADKKLYALRDVTATVESIPLITASIMSKKIAEGIDALVLDVKVGNGAFMKNPDDARNLARKMVEVGKMFGKKVTAFLTDMNQPLGNEIGNWREIVESVKVLRSECNVEDVEELTVSLTSEVVRLCLGISPGEAEGIVRKKLKDGSGYEKFREMVAAQGGDVSFIDNLQKYPEPKVILEIKGKETGYVGFINAYRIGMAAVKLGAGRLKLTDSIDPVAGIRIEKKVGDFLRAGDVIAFIYGNDEKRSRAAYAEVEASFEISSEKPHKANLILERIYSE